MNLKLDLLQIYWLFALPLPWLWLHWRRGKTAAWPKLIPVLAIRYPLLKSDDRQSQADDSKRSPLNDKLTAIAITLMILSLAQPVQYTDPLAQIHQSDPVDLVLVVGTAISMTLRDYSINGKPVDRMSLTRTLLDSFIENYSGKRIGLVILGNPPSLWLPLTTDKAVVRDAVSRIRTVLGGRLSNMGKTLQLVADNFTQSGEKVVVLVSDGGLQLGSVSPQQAAKNLAKAGFNLYVLAMGSSAEETGASTSSGLIHQPTDLNMLQQLAELGKGEMFHAKDAQAFSDALRSIEQQHRQPIPQAAEKRMNIAWYPLPLTLALCLLLYAALAPKGGLK